MPIGDVDPEEFFLRPELDEMKQVFIQYDDDNSGSVTAKELKPLFGRLGMNMKGHQLDAIIREYDLDGSGEVEFEEFIVMMIKLLGKRVRCDLINYREYLTDSMIENFERAFRLADVSANGRLGRDEVDVVIQRMGQQLTRDQLDGIFDEVDKDLSGEIEFDEFCSMMVKITGVRKRINAREYLEKGDVEMYRKAFDLISSDSGGSISAKDLDRLLRKIDVILRVDQVDALLEKYDADGSGEIDFVEFLSMIVDLKKLRRIRRISPETYTIQELKQLGFSAQEVKLSGFPPSLMRDEGWPIRDMMKAFKPLELRHAGYSAKDLREGGLGPAVLRRIGYSSSELRNAGFSTRSVKSMNLNLDARPDTVPHFDYRKLKSAPRTPGQSTPRIRHFSDDLVAISSGNTRQYQLKVRSVSDITDVLHARDRAVSMLSNELGLVKRVKTVTL